MRLCMGEPWWPSTVAWVLGARFQLDVALGAIKAQICAVFLGVRERPGELWRGRVSRPAHVVRRRQHGSPLGRAERPENRCDSRILAAMNSLVNSFWRAALYCLHPKVIGLSLLPLLVMTALALGLGYFYWETAIDLVRDQLNAWSSLQSLHAWLEKMGWAGIWTTLAPLLVVMVVTPVIVVLSLLLVAALMTPSMARLVAKRRFPTLDRKQGGSFWGGAMVAFFSTLLALLLLVLSIPLWLIPPLILILPPLIWGWLTYKVMSYDVLADFATADERRALIRAHRPALLGMGILTGYLGAAPSLVFASSMLTVLMAPVLVPVAIWIYTLVFAFSALWFSHFLLAALAKQRGEMPVDDGTAVSAADEVVPAQMPAIATPQTSPSLLPPP
jgi:Etoposide-induced protein 2.4 (EI24)